MNIMFLSIMLLLTRLELKSDFRVLESLLVANVAQKWCQNWVLVELIRLIVA